MIDQRTKQEKMEDKENEAETFGLKFVEQRE